jgi:hypothetical protein
MIHKETDTISYSKLDLTDEIRSEKMLPQRRMMHEGLLTM